MDLPPNFVSANCASVPYKKMPGAARISPRSDRNPCLDYALEALAISAQCHLPGRIRRNTIRRSAIYLGGTDWVYRGLSRFIAVYRGLSRVIATFVAATQIQPRRRAKVAR